MKRGKIIWFLVIVLLLTSCHAHNTSTPDINEVHPELKNIPIYSDSSPLMGGMPGIDRPQEGHKVYSYIAQTVKSETLQSFYEETMPATGWELFGNQEIEVGNSRSTTLLFSKAETIAEIVIMPWSAGSHLVIIDLSSSPNPK